MALAETLKDPRALPAMAAHLSDENRQARYLALLGMQNARNEKDCHQPANLTEDEISQNAEHCKAWGDREGRLRDWTHEWSVQVREPSSRTDGGHRKGNNAGMKAGATGAGKIATLLI
jgi:hypothetical protein